MKLFNRIAAALSIALGAYAAVSALEMNLMVNRAPGPGFLPFGIGMLLILVGLLILAGTFSAHADNRPASFNKEELSNLGIITGGSVAVLALTPLLGIIIPLGLMTGALARLMGERRKPVLLMLTILTPIVLYLIFGVGLSVRLPVGIFKS